VGEEQHLQPAVPEDGGAMEQVAAAPVPLERDVFLRTLVRELAGTLENVIGLEEASGYISVVGQAVGDQIDADYRRALAVEKLDREQVSAVLVDLKRRIKGDFYVKHADEKKIVFGNRACPFAEKVIGRPSMCMMTSNVFGSIAANNLGYAKVELRETIAKGAAGCDVVVHLDQQGSDDVDGREYFAATDP
jgi:predicted ArsR family transcriptional regulator